MTASRDFSFVNNFLSANIDKILLALIVISLLTLIVFISVNKKLSSITKKYNELMSGMEGKNLEDMLINCLEEAKGAKKDLSELKSKIDDVDKQSKLAIKKVYLKRYNAFPDVGSDLSFSVVFLNEYNTGVLLTGIYARDENRVYLKPIINGDCSYALSPEEKEIIAKAKNG